jgi:hypothetical protein
MFLTIITHGLKPVAIEKIKLKQLLSILQLILTRKLPIVVGFLRVFKYLLTLLVLYVYVFLMVQLLINVELF